MAAAWIASIAFLKLAKFNSHKYFWFDCITFSCECNKEVSAFLCFAGYADLCWIFFFFHCFRFLISSWIYYYHDFWKKSWIVYFNPFSFFPLKNSILSKCQLRSCCIHMIIGGHLTTILKLLHLMPPWTFFPFPAILSSFLLWLCPSLPLWINILKESLRLLCDVMSSNPSELSMSWNIVWVRYREFSRQASGRTTCTK